MVSVTAYQKYDFDSTFNKILSLYQLLDFFKKKKKINV